MKQRSAVGKNVWLAAAANLAIAFVKFLAAAATGSTGLLAEGIHSVVDTGDEALLLLGLHRSRRHPDRDHPFGYGKELFFWSLVVAMMIFALGGGFALYQGITGFRNPHPLSSPIWAYAVLALSFLFEGISWLASYRALRKERSSRPVQARNLLTGLHESKDPAVFTVLFEDSAALLGLGLATLGFSLGLLTGNPRYDAAASIGIGLLLGVAAFFLANECRNLLIGESLAPEIVADICQIAEREAPVSRVLEVLSMHFGPREALVTMRLELKPGLGAREVVAAFDRLERKLRNRHPEIQRFYIDVASFAPMDCSSPIAASSNDVSPTADRRPAAS